MAQMNWTEMREKAEKDGGFAPIPIGTYDFQIVSTEVKPSKSGIAQVLGRMQILTGPLAGQGTLNRFAAYKNDGEPNNMFFVQLAALGVGKEDPIWGQMDASGSFDAGMALLAGHLLNRQCIATIEHKKQGDRTYDNVRNMKPIGTPISAGVPSTQVPVASVPAAVPTAATAIPQQVAPQPVAPAEAQAPMQPVAPVAPVAAPVAPVAAPVAPVAEQVVAAIPTEVAPAAIAAAQVAAAAPVAMQAVVATSAPVMPVSAAQVVEAAAPVAIVPAPEATPAATPEAVVAAFPTPPNEPF